MNVEDAEKQIGAVLAELEEESGRVVENIELEMIEAGTIDEPRSLLMRVKITLAPSPRERRW
jgi:hypothetical protein